MLTSDFTFIIPLMWLKHYSVQELEEMVAEIGERAARNDGWFDYEARYHPWAELGKDGYGDLQHAINRAKKHDNKEVIVRYDIKFQP